MHGRPSIRQSRQGGFTLLELLVVMTVAAIMMAIAVPSFRTFTAGQRVKSVSSDVTAAMLLARSEAIKRNHAITIAPTGGSWVNGWTVQDTVASPAVTLGSRNPLGGLAVTGPASVVYQGNGRIGAASSFQLASSTDPSIVRCVKVDLTGVPSTSSGACP
ncbi:MAG: GspH/FimT family pseudopilin [Ramlibacter sp.]